MNDSTESSLIDLLKKTRDIAQKHLTATIETTALYGGKSFRNEGKEDFIEKIFAGLSKEDRFELKQIEQNLLTLYPTPEKEVDHLTKLLGVWLTWYFGGVPAVQLWQHILGRLRRDVALPTFAFKMKAYGDVYRIERRRYAERAKLLGEEVGAEAALESLQGIVTVVDHSTITHADEEWLLLDPLLSISEDTHIVRADDSSADKRSVLEHLLQLTEQTPEEQNFCITALTEMLARSYCSVQIFRYIKAQLPIDLFLISSNAEVLAPAREFSTTRLDRTKNNQYAYFFPADSDSVKGIPVCVIGTHTGVVREDGQWLGSPAGRKFDTRRFTRLAKKVRELKKKSDKLTIFP